MRTRNPKRYRSALLSLFTLPFISAPLVAQVARVPARITQPVSDKQLITLHGNVHPLARPEFDQGPAPLDLRMDRMLLVLQRSPEQEAALQKLLQDQQDKASPHYHQWLTPEQFGQQFGPADDDIQKVLGWLRGRGFQNVQPSKGRTIIEFSGTAIQVEQTFGTAIRKFAVNGLDHWANLSDPAIPVALSPVVAGVLTLHNFYKSPQVQIVEGQFTATIKAGARPQFTASAGQHALVPADYYTIYNFNPLQIFTGAKIALVGRSNISLQDVIDFHFFTFDQAESPQILLNGPDPGNLGGGEETEAVLDTTWAGAVAPTASVTLVVSKSTATTDGVDLSELYIIDNNIADVMSESFGDCEANFTSTQAMGVASLAQQAAAQGITYVVSAGDSGAAGCDNPHTATTASHPVSVNLLAATPYNVAVGGTMFAEGHNAAAFWKSTSDPTTLGSAISYIPENVWNESCTSGQSACAKANIFATGGGPSTFFAKPSWQSGVTGIPADNARHIPDVSLTAAGHDPYLLCIRASCVPNAQGQIRFAGVSGTSASAPAFAGIMALVGQKNLVRLGQPNYVLYRLATTENIAQCNASSATSLPPSSCVFNDVTVGNNSVPGETGFGTSSAKFQSGPGYDQATGLGSVNVTTLINQWNSVTFNPTNTAFSITPLTATHGDPLNVTVNVTPNTGTGSPTGVVWLLQNGFPQGNFKGDNTADIFTLNTQASFTGVTHLLPGGTYQVNAHYAGDGTFAASDSTPAVQVTIQPEETTITFSVFTTDANGAFVPFTAGPFGSSVFYQAHVMGKSGFGVPTTHVNFGDTNGDGAPLVPLDNQGNARIGPLNQIPAGPHSITAVYFGDNSFNTSANLNPIPFTISQVSTVTALAPQQSTQSLLLTATVSASGLGSAPRGLITFKNGNTLLGTAFLDNPTSSAGTVKAAATLDGTQFAAGQYNVIASYAGDNNYTPSVSTPVALTLNADFTIADRGITSQTVVAGQTAQYINDIGVTPFFGFNSDVAVSCSVPAPLATCSLNATSLTTSSGPNIASVMVTTKPRTKPAVATPIGYLPSNRTRPVAIRVLAILALLCASPSCAVLLRLSQSRHRLLRTLAFASLLFVVGVALAACGGGGGGTVTQPPPPPPQTGTPAGTYTVTVTGTSNSTTHTMTLTLIVQ
jgi:hypothetical protein